MPTEINRELWPPDTDTHTRQWMAMVRSVGSPVTVRHAAILAPGEDLTEFPPTYLLTWEEWVATHETVYGLTIDGISVAIQTERRAAWRKLRRMANGEAEYTEEEVRAVFGAVRRILRDLIEEVVE